MGTGEGSPEGSSVIRVAFHITERLYSSDWGVCGELHILLVWLVLRKSLVLCLIVSKFSQEEMLNVRIDPMRER